MLSRAHMVAAAIAAATILSFLISSIAIELLGGPAHVAQVKRLVAWGLLVLVPAMAAAGATGIRLAKGRSGRLLRTKLRRTVFAAANGVLVLAPAALYLDRLAQRGELRGTFAVVQAVEVVAGAVNLLLVGLNVRDGLLLAGRLHPRGARALPPGSRIPERRGRPGAASVFARTRFLLECVGARSNKVVAKPTIREATNLRP